MARDRANIRTDMIGDDKYRELTHSEQWLYKLLLIHPSLSYAGVADWRPGKLASTTSDLTAEDVRRIGQGLQAKYFIYIDEETEEVFIRSFVKHDGLLKQHRLPISMANDYAAISSKDIRKFFVHELGRAKEKFPNLKCWEMDRVTGLLERDSADMKKISYGDTLPIAFAEGYGKGYGIGYGNGYAETSVEGYGLLTATATATSTSLVSNETKELPGASEKTNPEAVHELPKNWKPDPADLQTIRKKNHNVNKIVSAFVERAEGVKVRDWDQKFTDHVRNLKYQEPSPWN